MNNMWVRDAKNVCEEMIGLARPLHHDPQLQSAPRFPVPPTAAPPGFGRSHAYQKASWLVPPGTTPFDRFPTRAARRNLRAMPAPRTGRSHRGIMDILLVDDHHLIREALHGIFAELVPDANVVEAATADQALRCLRKHAAVQLAVIDLTLPDRDGFSLLSEVKHAYPTLPCLVVSAETSHEQILRALDLGAVGFIPKTAARVVMVNAVRLVLAGGIYVPPEALARPPSAPAQDVPDAPARRLADLGLTDRQAEVLALMIEGRSNKWICRALDLAEPTVKHHVTAILKALKVTNRTEAAIAVVSMRLDIPARARG